MTKEQIIKTIREEYRRCLHLSAELSDTDEDYNYLDGVLDGRMRSLRLNQENDGRRNTN